MGTPNKITPEVLTEILRRYNLGEDQVAIGKALRLNRGTVARHLRVALGVATPEHWRGGVVTVQRVAQPKAPRKPFAYPENPTTKLGYESMYGESTRFWSKVAAPNENGCRLWLASLKPDGGGQFGTMESASSQAYRVAWWLTYGPIPKGLNVNHRCDVRACCEPTHLWLGTQADNMADMAAKGRRMGRMEGQKGEDNVKAKLTWEKVREMRRMRTEEGLPLHVIGERFGVCMSQVSNIVNYRQWPEPDGGDEG